MAMENSSFKIILGSSSMARREILAEMGYEFTIITADIDERSIRKKKPEELVMALAHAKADAIISRLSTMGQLEEDVRPTLLITADTEQSEKNHRARKKHANLLKVVSIHFPNCRMETCVMSIPCKCIYIYVCVCVCIITIIVAGYSGGVAAVVGSVVVTNLTTGNRKGGWERAEVYFHDIPDVVIDSLVEEGTILNVAGGLMLEHPLTLPLVDTVVGSADSVMGLSKALTEKLIQEALSN